MPLLTEGLSSFDDKYRLIVGKRINDFLPNEELERSILTQKGMALALPEKNLPSKKALEWHRTHLFQS